MQVENQREALRQRSVADLVGTEATMSNIQRQAEQNKLAQAQEARLASLTPLQIEAARQELLNKQQEVRASQALVEQRNQALSQAIAMAPIEQRQALLNQLATEALTQQRRAETGEVGAARRQAGEQFQQTTVPITVPDPDHPGQRIPARAAVSEILGAEAKKQALEHQQATEALATTKEQRVEAASYRKQQQDMFDAARGSENAILKAPSDPGITGDVDVFNSSSDKPYMYTAPVPKAQIPVTGGGVPFTGDRARKIPLIDSNGKPIAAWQVARKAAAMQPPMTPLEYVEKVMYGGKLP